MIHYLLFNNNELIVQRGVSPTEEEIPSLPNMRVEIIQPEDTRQPYKGPPPNYVDYRRAAYPTTGEQMDMFWHAMNDGTMAKIEPFYSTIKAVKDAYPKPST